MIIDCIESESRAQGNSTQQSEGHGQYGKGHASYKMCCQPFPDDDCPTKDRQHYATSSYKRKKHQWIALPENRKNSGEHSESILDVYKRQLLLHQISWTMLLFPFTLFPLLLLSLIHI